MLLLLLEPSVSNCPLSVILHDSNIDRTGFTYINQWSWFLKRKGNIHIARSPYFTVQKGEPYHLDLYIHYVGYICQPIQFYYAELTRSELLNKHDGVHTYILGSSQE